MDDPFVGVLNCLRKEKKRLGCSNTGAVYRGHGDSSWRLTPTILRSASGYADENNLYEHFVARGYVHHDASKNGWEILADMQHHGVPTRLLDWSFSFAAALYFAMLNPVTRKRRCASRAIDPY